MKNLSLKASLVVTLLLTVGTSAFAQKKTKEPTPAPSWTKVYLKGIDKQLYTLHVSPDGKAMWSDALLGGAANLDPAHDFVYSGNIDISPAAATCKQFGQALKIGTENLPGKVMTLASKDNYERFMLDYFKSVSVRPIIDGDDASAGLAATDSNEIYSVFPDMKGHRFWTSTQHPTYTADAFFFDPKAGHANNYGGRRNSENYVRCIVL